MEYVRNITSTAVQRLVSGSQDSDAAAAADAEGGYDVDSLYSMPRSGTLSWSSVQSALPKPIKQLQQSFLGKASPMLPRTNHEAMRMSAAAQQNQIQIAGELLHSYNSQLAATVARLLKEVSWWHEEPFPQDITTAWGNQADFASSVSCSSKHFQEDKLILLLLAATVCG
jgi:hypothetical protein